MTTLLITLTVIPGLIIIVCILAAIVGLVDHILHPNGNDVSSELVRKQLELILDKSQPYALDDFISCGSFKNPRLEAIRKRIAQLDEEFPPESKGEYCNPKGIEIIRGYIRELEHESTA